MDFFYDSLGKLCTNYIKGADGLPMPIEARLFVESINEEKGLNDFAIGYLIGTTSFRVRTISDGRDLLNNAKEYDQYATLLKDGGYEKTAIVIKKLADYFFREAGLERDAAVDG